MILTVTMNPAIDKAMSVPDFQVGKTNRARVERVDPGGKGINVAQAVKLFGCPVMATGMVAGANGRYILEEMQKRGIPADFVQANGETRVNLKISDPDSGIETEINEAGFFVDEQVLLEHERKLAALLPGSAIAVFSGSLPPGAPCGCYARFIRLAKDAGCKTILDTSGPALRQGLVARPDVIKPNQAEAEELLGGSLESEDDLVKAGPRLLDFGCQTALISLGRRGALLASRSVLLRAYGPVAQAAPRTTGAGDAMVGAMACAMLQNAEPTEALRWAMAAGAASAAARTHIAGIEQIRAMAPQIRITSDFT